MEILNEQKLKYLSRRETEIKQIYESIEANNFNLAIEIGHRLKGNGRTFGYPIISEIGWTLESGGKLQNKDKVLNGVRRLQAEIEKELKLLIG
ncbi:MAG: Hpt domain-containing protein [Bacteriovoracaceae bacterium]